MTQKSTHPDRPFQHLFSEETREHAEAARAAWRKSVAGLFPAEFLQQRRIARKEMLLAVRSAIDTALDKMGNSEDQ